MSEELALCIKPNLEDQVNFGQGFIPLDLDKSISNNGGSSADFGPPRLFYFPGTLHIGL